MTADLGGRLGGTLAWKARSSPRVRVLPVACQRPRPMRAMRPRTEATWAGGTSARAASPLPSSLGEDAVGFRAGLVEQDAGGGGGVALAGAFADQDGGDGAGGGGLGGGEFEGEDLLFDAGGVGEGVEEVLLGGLAERGEAVEGGEAGGGEVDAVGLAASAGVLEDDAVAGFGRHGGGAALKAGVIDGGGDGGVVEGDFDGAEEDEAASAREGARIEDASEIVGRKGAQHAMRVGPFSLPGEQGRGGAIETTASPAEEGRATAKGPPAATID